jgi:hypothetical protein
MTRELIERSPLQLDTAQDVVRRLTGEELKVESAFDAKLIAMDVVHRTVKANCNVSKDVLSQSIDHIKALRTDPTKTWMFAIEIKKDESPGSVLVAGTDTKVIFKDNGKIKKGGKGALAEELYKKRVLTSTAPMTIQTVVEMFVKEIGFTKAGAQTYVYNFMKALGEPKGGLVRGAKGKKAKA